MSQLEEQRNRIGSDHGIFPFQSKAGDAAAAAAVTVDFPILSFHQSNA
jgi:hypothetical protein